MLGEKNYEQRADSSSGFWRAVSGMMEGCAAALLLIVLVPGLAAAQGLALQIATGRPSRCAGRGLAVISLWS